MFKTAINFARPCCYITWKMVCLHSGSAKIPKFIFTVANKATATLVIN